MDQYLGTWLQAAAEELESVSLFRVKHVQLTFVCNERRNGGWEKHERAHTTSYHTLKTRIDTIDLCY